VLAGPDWETRVAILRDNENVIDAMRKKFRDQLEVPAGVAATGATAPAGS
jgi:hypothetical protein